MSEDDDLPRLLSGRYRLEETLGRGGMGVVYRGVDLLMKRAVAVKLIRGVDGVELDDEVAGRFLREAKNTARLQNEHIVEVFDLGRSDDGGLYFVMELLEGESLSARLRRDGTLSPQTTVHIARQICDALSVAHTIGVIHRDLKPANVMLLSRAGDDDYVKVLDFGVAKSYSADQDTQLTQTGMLVGTVDYMAPEQIMGKAVDGRTDVYSLGVVLYKMLSGKAPFKDNGVPSLIHAHLNTMPKPLIEVAKNVPNELDRVVLRCLMKSPDRRYDSMAELGRALTAAIMPDGDGLIDIEYGRTSDSDPYAADDQTKVGRFDPTPVEVPQVALDAGAYDDATVRMDRPFVLSKKPGHTPLGLPMTPRGSPLRSTVSIRTGPPPKPSNPPPRPRPPAAPDSHPRVDQPDPTAWLQEEASTKKRLAAGGGAPDTQTCAMCQTGNAPHARVCAACGVSLSNMDQDGLRARNQGSAHPPDPSARPHGGAALGVPRATGNFGMAGRVPPPPPSNPGGNYGMPGAMPGPMQGMPGPMHAHPMQPWGHPAPQPPPPSMWERFLTWTGLRTR